MTKKDTIHLTPRQKELLGYLKRGWNLCHPAMPYNEVTLFKKRITQFESRPFVELKNLGLLEHSHCNWVGVHWKLSSLGKSIQL